MICPRKICLVKNLLKMKEIFHAPGREGPPIIEPYVWGPERVEFGRFSKEQREWLLSRDSENGIIRCQMRKFGRNGNLVQCPNNEKKIGRQNLHAHHIIPAGFFKKWISQIEEVWESENQPENGIILCKDCHNGVNGIHPDYGEAYRKYKNNPAIFKEIAQLHHDLTELGKPYWNQTWDAILWRIATERTETFMEKNPNRPWPKDKGRKIQ